MAGAKRGGRGKGRNARLGTGENFHVFPILVPIALFASLSRRGLGTRNEGLWRQRIFEFFDWLLENKGILSGSENIRAYLLARNFSKGGQTAYRNITTAYMKTESPRFLGLENPLSPEPFVSRAKAPPAKRRKKGYGDENGVFLPFPGLLDECFAFNQTFWPTFNNGDVQLNLF